jgi:hypothetical protein
MADMAGLVEIVLSARVVAAVMEEIVLREKGVMVATAAIVSMVKVETVVMGVMEGPEADRGALEAKGLQEMGKVGKMEKQNK